MENTKNTKSSFSSRRKKELLFYICVMAYPIIQVLIFYFAVNFNSVLLAFKRYTVDKDGNLLGYTWYGLNNFRSVFSDLKNEFVMKASLRNSFLAFGVQIIISTPLALLFSYYIFNKKFGSGAFRIFLFLPSVISPLVIVIIYKTLLEEGLPELLTQILNREVPRLYSNNRMFALLFYYVWTGFGTNVLLYTSAMTSIDTSVMEASELDGATSVKGFVYVVFPLIYPTFMTFMTINIATIFTNQLNIFSFEPEIDKKYYTFGYFLYLETARSGSYGNYPYLSAMGLVLTAVAVPITLILRRIMLKLGPSEE